MFVLFGLFAITIKITILSAIYASLTFGCLYILYKLTGKSIFIGKEGFKFYTWLGILFLYGIGLFCYFFSFWGFSGIGDEYCIPVGNGYVVYSIDAMEDAWFEPEGDDSYKQVTMRKFAVKDGKICGDFIGHFSDDCKGCFVVFDTDTKQMTQLKSLSDYEAYAQKNNLPKPDEFVDFSTNFSNYFGGLRAWLLP